MDLPGQLSNPPVKGAWADLAQRLAVRLRSEPASCPSWTPRETRRPGQIFRVVVAVIADADGTMRTCDVHRAVEERLGEAVSWSTVRNALVEGHKRPECAVNRIAYGLYEGKAAC
jgi:hypothetical protein